MTTVEFQGGRRPVDHTKPKLMLTPRLVSPESPPPTADYLSKVLQWPMYANDQCGDCTIATVGHALQALSTYGKGAEVRLSDDEVLNKYVALSGYNPQTGENDTGLIVQDVLNDWRKVGYWDPAGENHRSLIFAYVEPTNLNAIRSAINVFGWVYMGVTITEATMAQFNGGQIWDISGQGDYSEVLGGHAIPCGAYDDGGFDVVTWGKVQYATQRWMSHNLDECWVVITPEWLDANGYSPGGLDLHGLGEDFALLTGNANPFPEPAPEPEPIPVTPVDPVDPGPVPVEPEPPLPVFAMPACLKHLSKGHKWWCKACDTETESQFKQTAEALWALRRETKS